MNAESVKFFSGIDFSGKPVFFAARTKGAMKCMIESVTEFTEWTQLSIEQLCKELHPFSGMHYVSIVGAEFEDRPNATVLQFPEEAMRDE